MTNCLVASPEPIAARRSVRDEGGRHGSEILVVSAPALTCSTLSETWEAVYRSRTTAGPYLCPSWVKVWIETYGATLRPELLAFHHDNHEGPVGACLLTRRSRFAGVFSRHRVHLNTSGEPEGHGVVVQHNDILTVPGSESQVLRALARHVVQGPADEFCLPGIEESRVREIVAAFPGWDVDVEWLESPYVDLRRLRAAGGDHLAMLSRNTREQVKRSLTRYASRGPITIEQADTPQLADDMLSELIALHEVRWRAVGKGGGFASADRVRFHRAFVEEGMQTGNVQFLRVAAGGRTVGILYNLLANGKVNFYQSGLCYEDDKHLKPGLVTHHLAIGHCLEAGYLEYDFLVSGPGEGRYKASLSDRTRRLGWVILSRPGVRRQYFSAVREVRRRLRAMFGPSAGVHEARAVTEIVK